MDRFQKNPEPFLRRSATIKTAQNNDSFKNYRAKTGHDARYGKAHLKANIRDLSTDVEIGQTEDDQSPLVVMSARADKRFDHDLRSNKVDMNRAYKRRFAGRPHYTDLNQESVLPESSLDENAFKYKRHMKRASKDTSQRTEGFDTPMPFMDTEEDEEAIMNLNERLMENRADATLHRGRDPTEVGGLSAERQDIEESLQYHRKIEHLKNEKQKMYFKQFSRVWEDMRRGKKGRSALFPQGTEEEDQTDSPQNTSTNDTEGVNAYDSEET